MLFQQQQKKRKKEREIPVGLHKGGMIAFLISHL
jgi:hypothetical protein